MRVSFAIDFLKNILCCHLNNFFWTIHIVERVNRDRSLSITNTQTINLFIYEKVKAAFQLDATRNLNKDDFYRVSIATRVLGFLLLQHRKVS